MTESQWLTYTSKWLESQWGIAGDWSDRVALFLLNLYWYKLQPVITSGYRSPAKQRELYNRWLSGDRSVITPAKPGTSKHERIGMFGKPASHGIDIVTNNDQAAAYLAQALGLRPGLYFRKPDRVHFEKV